MADFDETKAAAILIFQHACKIPGNAGVGTGKCARLNIEHLRKKASDAAELLANAERKYALSVALDLLMPGWVYVDVSEHLPISLEGQFISSSPEEWVAWLTAHGVAEDAARTLVTQQFLQDRTHA